MQANVPAAAAVAIPPLAPGAPAVSAPSAIPTTPPVPPLAVLGVILAPFLSVLVGFTFSPLLPTIAADLGVGIALMGQVPALMSLVAAVVGLVVGPLADTYGYRRVLVAGAITLTVCAAGIGASQTFLMLAVAALVGALGRSALTSVSVAFAGSRFEGTARQRAISWTAAGMSGAGIVGVPPLTYVADVFGWRAAFAVLTLACLCVSALMWLTLPSEARKPSVPDPAAPGSRTTQRWPSRARATLQAMGAAYAPLVRHQPTIGVILATGTGACMMFAALTYLGALTAQRFGYSAQQIGWVFFAISVAFLGGTLLAGGRVGRLPPRPVLIATRGVTGAALFGAFALPLPAPTVIVLAVVGVLANGVSNVCTSLLLTAETPGGRATTMSLNSLAVNLGAALGSSVGGLLLATGGFPAVGAMMLVYGLAGIALLTWSGPLR